MDNRFSLAQILAHNRGRVVEPVSLEEVFALHDATLGETALSEGERIKLLERVRADPEASRRLLKLMRFPEAEEESDSFESVDTRWRLFRERLRADTGFEGRFDELAPASEHPPSTRLRVWHLAASFLIGGLLMWWLTLQMSPGYPAKDANETKFWVNIPILELVDDGSAVTREPKTVRFSSGAGGLLVTLFTSSQLPEAGPFTIKVSTPTRLDLPLISGLEPGPGGVFVLGLPKEMLANGPYRLELRHEDEIVAEFFVRIEIFP